MFEQHVTIIKIMQIITSLVSFQQIVQKLEQGTVLE